MVYGWRSQQYLKYQVFYGQFGVGHTPGGTWSMLLNMLYHHEHLELCSPLHAIANPNTFDSFDSF